MAVEKIGVVAPKVVNKTKNVAKQQKTHNPVNSYEFHLGFIPQNKPHGKGLNSDEQIERIIDAIV